MKRRNLLGGLVTAACATTLPSTLTLADSASQSKRRIQWRNWSGSQSCYPSARKAPKSVTELQEIITNAKGTVRPVGAGHSFMPLVPTEDTIVSLSRMSGVIDHDEASQQAVILAGTRLGDIGAPLAEHGQAMINMPDIDEQSLAGALGTATHGTGATLGCMPANVTALKLVTASGDLLECSPKWRP
ncbi:MAG: FAD-binding protein, partial [Pseudomonadota bacterium]